MKHPEAGVGVIVMRDGKFLVLQRQGSHGEGTWSVPGGWMELGESFEQASVREIDEETGMKIKNVRFAGVTNNVMLDENVHSITIWTMADWAGVEPSITEPEKCADQRWVDFDTLPSPLFKAPEELLKSEFLPAIKEQLASTKNS